MFHWAPFHLWIIYLIAITICYKMYPLYYQSLTSQPLALVLSLCIYCMQCLCSIKQCGFYGSPGQCLKGGYVHMWMWMPLLLLPRPWPIHNATQSAACIYIYFLLVWYTNQPGNHVLICTTAYKDWYTNWTENENVREMYYVGWIIFNRRHRKNRLILLVRRFCYSRGRIFFVAWM